jgi:hypothetical protein
LRRTRKKVTICTYLVETKQDVFHLDLQVNGHLRVDIPGINEPLAIIEQHKQNNKRNGTNWKGSRTHLTFPEVKKMSGLFPSFMSFIPAGGRGPR